MPELPFPGFSTKWCNFQRGDNQTKRYNYYFNNLLFSLPFGFHQWTNWWNLRWQFWINNGKYFESKIIWQWNHCNHGGDLLKCYVDFQTQKKFLTVLSSSNTLTESEMCSCLLLYMLICWYTENLKNKHFKNSEKSD